MGRATAPGRARRVARWGGVVEGGPRVSKAHIEGFVGDALTGGEGEGGGAPRHADGHKLLQGGPEGEVPLLVHHDGWQQSGSLVVSALDDH